MPNAQLAGFLDSEFTDRDLFFIALGVACTDCPITFPDPVAERIADYAAEIRAYVQDQAKKVAN